MNGLTAQLMHTHLFVPFRTGYGKINFTQKNKMVVVTHKEKGDEILNEISFLISVGELVIILL